MNEPRITEMRLMPQHVLVFYADGTCEPKPYKMDPAEADGECDGSYVDLFPDGDPHWTKGVTP